ncbi:MULTISPECIES: tripartite tricarboxylate transporter substrate-binding protein [unclassified Beijerinckia]|uniref:Bug family tripartite tricarboxylate transporter substrate binding protein n=1 Tax=unclassified Beijerinckia TaxID=2638183 RepID=UPI000898C8D2|nr:MULTISPECIES: tripartite tricarboxylate transporter substrate-binding protein [unclassified Beijerinckia]MDH7797527.1 tripartite-type tricarboxylate transporter receptor subunit TctC [Beijerinckia sp. GAS462]SEC89214.1 Tripartite-type tricarboxylate transporter, receptor component TctC [Beijerinckia sp. 28-YEA-48]
MNIAVPKARSLYLFVALTMLALFPQQRAAAQTSPSGPVRIIVGFGAGSTADIVARLVGRHMESVIGQPIIVENRPGNSSMVAAETVARAPKDGQTLFMATVANTLNPVQARLPFNLGKDMEPVALLGVSPNVLVVHPSVAARNVKELMAIAKSKPDTLTFGTSGAGTASDLATRLFNIKAGSNVVSVPYQGGANQGMTDLLTGRINAMFNVGVALAPHVASGALVALAVGQPKRATILPDVPTMDEQGIPGFDVGIWIGLLAPGGTPASIVDQMAQAANGALKTEMVMTSLKTQGIDPIGATPAEFRKFIEADIEKWRSILAASPQQ